MDLNMHGIDLLEFGNTIQIVGVVWGSKNGKNLCSLLPGENWLPFNYPIELTNEEWEKVLRQMDEQNVMSNIMKAVVRKTQRQVDANTNWKVFRRDGYACRYCGTNQVALTVDHVDLWEDGGASIEDNLVTSCRKCNRTRGNMKYYDWINSPEYAKASSTLHSDSKKLNEALVNELTRLESLRPKKQRSR